MSISEADLAKARQVWGDGLVAISKAYEEDGIDGARTVAGQVIDAAYGYDMGPVLFKPTMASERPSVFKLKCFIVADPMVRGAYPNSCNTDRFARHGLFGPCCQTQPRCAP